MRLPLRPASVALGGALGSWARWGLAAAFPVAAGTFPTTTLVINVVGAALLGVVLVALLDGPRPRTHLHALVGTGLLGAFTTFSTFAVESVELVRLGRPVTAVLYLVVSVAAGLLSVLATMALARRVWHRAVPA